MSAKRHPVISAEHRLAQTRAEICDLILPETYAPPPVSRPAAPSVAARARAATAARDHAQASFADTRAADAAHDDAAAAERAFYPYGAAAAMTEAARRPAPAASPFAWAPLLRRGASVWWRHHPAHAALEVADSMLSHVARRKPYQMLAVAAGVGALAMVIRPWRLVSVTGLAFAALKMTDVRSLFGSLRGD
ncbi:MAG: hypothetical protein ABI589_04620 [Burkholderiales bacterium]